MALTFPRNMTVGRCWDVAEFTTVHMQEMSRQWGGTEQAKDLGPTLWRATFQSSALLRAAADAIEADFMTLQGALRPFYATPKRRLPIAHGGQSLSGITVASVASGRESLGLAGLPAGYQLTAGDFLTVVTSSGVELLKAAQDVQANASGDVAALHVTHPVRVSVEAGQTVIAQNPYAEMKLIAGSLEKTRRGRLRFSVSFEALQVVR